MDGTEDDVVFDYEEYEEVEAVMFGNNHSLIKFVVIY